MFSHPHCPFIGKALATLLCAWLLWTAFQASSCNAAFLSLRMLHRFSPEVMEFGGRKNAGNSQPWPSKGTRKYYHMLYKQDDARHGRKLTAYQSLYFSEGNGTADYGEQFGWLHYAVMDLGTPNVSFLVALDTGSDLFWVPCDCKQCAPTSASSYGLEENLHVYNPTESRTSKHVACSNRLCDMGNTCESQAADCPYSVQYLSDNTSTSGMLIEDVIYLTSGDRVGHHKLVTTPVIFGCGRLQSGGFLDGGAPDGLLGLGLGDVSVPNFLAKAGLVDNSFSMCFQPDDSGRIFFGDKGASDQQTTPFLPINHTYFVYMVALEQIAVGSAVLDIPGLKTLVDSGTSFTYLPSEVYSALTTKFDEQVKETRLVLPNIPWGFCYDASKSQTLNGIPSMSLVFHGGGNFSVYSPLIGLYDEHGNLEAFCLGVLQGDIAILGQNFMTSYQLVFNREELKLGWSPSDCYNLEEGNPAPSPTMQETETSLKLSPSSAPLFDGHGQAPQSHAASPAIHDHAAGGGGGGGAGGRESNKGHPPSDHQPSSSREWDTKNQALSLLIIIFIFTLMPMV